MRILTMSDEGRDWIAKWEGGYRLKSYLCLAGVWTISAGVTRYDDGPHSRVREGETLVNMAAAKELFARRLKTYEAGVDALTRDDLLQQEFDALVSFAYNLGVGALASSTLVRVVNNQGPAEDIRAQLTKWIYANGRRVHGLWLRRTSEARCYLDGIYLGPGSKELEEP